MKYLLGEKFLMPHQDLPFNGDRYACAKFIALRNEFKITNAVELGCCVGGTTQWLAANFDNVHAIEINKDFLSIAMDRVGVRASNTAFYFGNTIDWLPKILRQVDDKTIFHVDSHWGPDNPLLAELEIIANSGLKPVIEIHDMKVPGRSDLGFDTYENITYEWSWIENSVEKIYGKNGYRKEYNNKAAGAKRGMIFLMPL